MGPQRSRHLDRRLNGHCIVAAGAEIVPDIHNEADKRIWLHHLIWTSDTSLRCLSRSADYTAIDGCVGVRAYSESAVLKRFV